ncbi:MAG: hypothetical protein DRJ60_01155 [Thermoprotei archaeon]|nr:MAG: hypothetical protein DRJ60_01155 [Thermoprotei archaeon]
MTDYIKSKLMEALEDIRDVLRADASYPSHVSVLKNINNAQIFIGFSPQYVYPNVRIEPGPFSVPRPFTYEPGVVVETLGRGDEVQVEQLMTLTAEVLDILLDSSNRRTAHDWVIVPGADVRTGLAPAPGRKGQFIRWCAITLKMQYGGSWYE